MTHSVIVLTRVLLFAMYSLLDPNLTWHSRYAGIVALRRRKLAAHTQHTMVTQKEDVDSEPASFASDVDGTIIISGEAPSGGDDTSERARLTASV